MTPKVLSLCTGGGVFDKAFIDAGYSVTAGCEIDPQKRRVYKWHCGGDFITDDIRTLADMELGQYDLVIGGIPCQSFSRLKSITRPKFGNLTEYAVKVIEKVKPRFYLLENVVQLAVPGCSWYSCDAMHYAQPHQSRLRYFTTTKGLGCPAPLYRGTADDLCAYPCVCGKTYGLGRACKLQGCEWLLTAPFSSALMVDVVVNAVHYGVASAWANYIKGLA